MYLQLPNDLVFYNAFLTEVNSDREQCIRHGLHLNSKGKKQSAKKIVRTLKDTLCEKKFDPITMKWKEMQVMDRQKNQIPVVHKTNIMKIKKLDQERTTDWLKIKKKANFKETVNWSRVKMSQPLYLLNDLADYLRIEVTVFYG
jgi:hypothetical protein